MNTQPTEWPLASVDASWANLLGGLRTPNRDEDGPSASRRPSDTEISRRRLILIVEDNGADVFLIRSAIKNADIDADLHVVRDGEQAVTFFEQTDTDQSAPCPALIILDINLPKKDGHQVLQELRQSRRCAGARIIAISTSAASLDSEQMNRLGANEYFHKPSTYAEFMKLGDVVKRVLNG